MKYRELTKLNYCQTPEKIFLTAIAILVKSSFSSGGQATPLRSPASNCSKLSTESKCSAEINWRSSIGDSCRPSNNIFKANKIDVTCPGTGG